jgi:hypothetical protein
MCNKNHLLHPVGILLPHINDNAQSKSHQNYKSSLHIINPSTERVECVCRYFLMATLNFALSFLRTVTLGGKLLKIFKPAILYFFENRIGWHLVYEDDAYSLY